MRLAEYSMEGHVDLKYLKNAYFPKLQFGDMNKCALFSVFLCGIVFSCLVSLLRTTINVDPFISNFYHTGVGIIPAEVDLELMDDGYVAMARMNYHYVDDNSESASKQFRKSNSGKGTDLEERSSEVEALNSLKAAVELTSAGKNARVGRLLEHAHSLAPRHHDVLLMYGEYLEQYRGDYIQADHLFLKALTVSPLSSRALRNRKRTQAMVEKIDTEFLNQIDNKRNELALIPSLSSTLRRVKKEAYFQHIYHTAAIEGNTLTLAQIRMILETGLSVEGKSVMEHNEILGIDSALKYINTTLIHRIGKITLKDILEIHKRVLGHVDPIEAGTMRTTQVFVSDHVPPPPSKIEVMMESFLSWLNSQDAQKLHPIKYAALAHYKLVFIHPFVDGNGRTARLLMNFLLMQAGYPPVIIRKQDRLHYYEYLQTANDGDTRPFIRFIARCMEKTIDVYLWATKEHLPELEQAVPYQNELAGAENIQETTPKLNPVTFLTDVRAESLATFSEVNTGFTIDQDDIEVQSLSSLKKGNKYSHLNDYETKEQDPSTTYDWLHENDLEKRVKLDSSLQRVLDEKEIYELSQEFKEQKTNLGKVLSKSTSGSRNTGTDFVA